MMMTMTMVAVAVAVAVVAAAAAITFRTVRLISGRRKGFFSATAFRRASGCHPVSYPVGTENSFPGGQRPGA